VNSPKVKTCTFVVIAPFPIIVNQKGVLSITMLQVEVLEERFYMITLDKTQVTITITEVE
jgi:hypothetical protein